MIWASVVASPLLARWERASLKSNVAVADRITLPTPTPPIPPCGETRISNSNATSQNASSPSTGSLSPLGNAAGEILRKPNSLARRNSAMASSMPVTGIVALPMRRWGSREQNSARNSL